LAGKKTRKKTQSGKERKDAKPGREEKTQGKRGEKSQDTLNNVPAKVGVSWESKHLPRQEEKKP